MLSVDGTTVTLTYDALDRMVEQARGTTYTQIVYSPSGVKLGLMNGQTMSKAYVPLVAGAEAVYVSGSLNYYRHPDWLGSARAGSGTGRGYTYDVNYGSLPASRRFVMRKRREEWQQDVTARQRNVVFPDTVQNEGRFWRNLASGKQKFTIVQAIGIALFFLAVIGLFWSDAAWKFRFAASGSIFDRLAPVFADWAIILGVFVVFFLLLRWRVRRALLSGRRPDRPR